MKTQVGSVLRYKQSTNLLCGCSPPVDFLGTVPDFSPTWRSGNSREGKIFTALTALRDKSELKCGKQRLESHKRKHRLCF